MTINSYNFAGALVKSEILRQNQRQIIIRDLCDGIYLIGINSKEGSQRQKLIIQR
ncbi:MAG: T9SS type A sorting domain-containing protein [Bacteroidetes bacterium]|nr:T9SS type A sorting domain-containing protein [Bacteroidota bacterium]MBU1719647.1 T9SS type A sorting domain-containing protein [Bacteroidota bacterium]